MALSPNQVTFITGRLAAVTSITDEFQAAIDAQDTTAMRVALNRLPRPFDELAMGLTALNEEGGPDGEFAPTHPKADLPTE